MKEKIMFGLVSIVIITLCIMGLQAQDNQVRKNAIERCGGENNIVERHTNQGDRYYTCKVEK